MSNPYQPPGPSPYLTTPMPAPRPRMFASTTAKVLWTLLPIVTLGLAATVPFVTAAVKGVLKPWVAAVYVVAEVALFGISTALVGPDEESPGLGFLLVLLIITAATHTSLLDHEKVTIGK